MQEVEVAALPLDRLASILSPERAQRLTQTADRARAGFGDRVIWHVNATSRGGGVAEMLQVLLAYGKGAQIQNRWLVLDGDPEFFVITKRLHNMLHGVPGDGGPLGPLERAHYDAVLAANLMSMLPLVSRGDVVLLHDPQTAGLAEGLRDAGMHVAWRCHVGRDEPNEISDAAWEFLRPLLQNVEAFVFSRRVYAPGWVDDARLAVIAPSIDPFAAKNTSLTPNAVSAILVTAGLVTGHDPGAPLHFTRRDGSSGAVRRHGDRGGLVLDGPPPPHDARLVLQVSRWDHLKDMAGVMSGFAQLIADQPHDNTHLMLAGPAVSGVTDDPEGAQVLAECREQWLALPASVRNRIHLVSIPMDDVDENAIIVNALQRHAYVVVQKSLVEGFGLTVTEAMWKGRPVVASKVGGIQDQIEDRRDGLLVEDPHNLTMFAATLARVLDDERLGDRLGAAGEARVRAEFLGDRHLEQYVDLFLRLLGPTRSRRHVSLNPAPLGPL